MPIKYREQTQKAVDQYHGTAWLLYAFSVLMFIPVLVKLLAGQFFSMLTASAVFAGVLLSAFWMSLGLKNKRDAIKNNIRFKRQIPLMFLSACLLGAANFTGAFLLTSYGLFASLGLGLAATVGAMMWYGLDPVVPKSFGSIEDEDQKSVLLAAEQAIVHIKKSSEKLKQPELSAYLKNIAESSSNIVQFLTEQPEKIRKAQRFLHHYLGATESVIKRYSETHDKVDDEQLESNFKQVLHNIDKVFKEQHNKLLEQDVFDLDVDIEVLNTLLEKQGIK